MVVADWEYEYNGLTFGGGQIIGVVNVEGLAETPEVKADIIPRTGAHGSAVFSDYYHERHVIITGDIMDDTPSDFEAHINTLRTTFAVRAADSNLLWKLPGFNRRRLPCKPLRMKLTMELGYDLGRATWIVELVAANPAIYDDVTSTKLFDG